MAVPVQPVVAAVASQDGPGFVGSLVLGIVEGLTEFLPISSTGHLIVANRLLGQNDPTYEVAIQAGAITAIAVLYRQQLVQAAARIFRPEERRGVNLFLLLFVAALPAAVVGVLFDDVIEAVLFSATTVAVTLVAGGVLLLVLERWLAKRSAHGEPASHEIEGMTLRQAFWIGVFQCLALVPGTSRSGATIAGALLLGFRRTAAAEFSFLVGLPILYGACALKAAQDWERLSGPLLGDFLVGAGASFVTALLIVGPFVRYLQRNTFAVFAWYRIGAGLVLFGLIGAGVLRG